MRAASFVQMALLEKWADLLPRIASESHFESIALRSDSKRLQAVWKAHLTWTCEQVFGLCSREWPPISGAKVSKASKEQQNDSLPRIASQNRIAAKKGLHT